MSEAMYLTRLEMEEPGDGEWTIEACGCRYAVGSGDGCVYVMVCDGHGVEHAKKFAREGLGI